MKAEKAVHKHEKHMHKGEKLTHFDKGGGVRMSKLMAKYGRNMAHIINQRGSGRGR